MRLAGSAIETRLDETALRRAEATARTEAARLSQLREQAEALIASFAGMNADFAYQDPDRSEVDGPWTEIGFRDLGAEGILPRDVESLQRARTLGRQLWTENEFARGAILGLQAFVVGQGIGWMVALEEEAQEEAQEALDAGNEAVDATYQALKRAARRRLRRFFRDRGLDPATGSVATTWAKIENDLPVRWARDGEVIVRLFPNPAGFPRFRFVEPSSVFTPPSMTPEQAENIPLGVEHLPGDLGAVVAYWIDEERVPVLDPLTGLQQIYHLKQGVDAHHPRGWPWLWTARRNLARGETHLRALSILANYQATIVAVRRHLGGTEGEAVSFVERDADLTLRDTVSGRSTHVRRQGPGTILEAGPGYTYETPIHSVHASDHVPVLQADLRAAAVSVGFAEFMFTGLVDTNYAGILAAEGPVARMLLKYQHDIGSFAEELLWGGFLEHEVRFGRLAEATLEVLDLQRDHPHVVVRDSLKEAQARMIEHEAGALSLGTWQAKLGLDPAEERRNLKEEAAAGFGPPAEPVMEEDPLGGLTRQPRTVSGPDQTEPSSPE